MPTTMDEPASSLCSDKLAEVRHSMYLGSERWWWAAFGLVALGIGAVILVITGALPEHSGMAMLATGISVATPALASAARWISGEHAGRGDLCRRLLLYYHAMGIDIDPAVARRVSLWPRTSVSPATTKPYFASDRAVGARRLLDDVGESAFFTAELARVTSKCGFIVVGTALALPTLACIAFSDVRLVISAQMSQALGVLAIFTAGVLVAEVFVHALHYYRLSQDSAEISRRASDLARQTELTTSDALSLAEDYSIALARNLPILNWLYEREKTRIEAAYTHALRTP